MIESQWVAKLKDASARAATTFVKADSFGLTLVESMGDASIWSDEFTAWRYAEMASREFSLAFVAAVYRGPLQAPCKDKPNTTKTKGQLKQSRRAKRKNYLTRRF